MRKIISMISLLFLLNSCSILILWNPVIKNTEFEEKINFNVDGIAISIPHFGFMNTWYGPFIEIKVGNYTDSLLIINNDNFLVVIYNDTLKFSEGNEGKFLPCTLLPNEEIEMYFEYEYERKESIVKLKNGTGRALQQPRMVKLIIGNFMNGKTIVELPTIEYRDPERYTKHKDYIEFKATKFL